MNVCFLDHTFKEIIVIHTLKCQNFKLINFPWNKNSAYFWNCFIQEHDLKFEILDFYLNIISLWIVYLNDPWIFPSMDWTWKTKIALLVFLQYFVSKSIFFYVILLVYHLIYVLASTVVYAQTFNSYTVKNLQISSKAIKLVRPYLFS